MKCQTREFLLTDQVGTLRAVADTSGAIVKKIDYDSFGNIIADSNPAFSVPFGFAGGLHDRDTGLVRFGYRDYSPELGRFVAKDPIDFAGGDTNLYAYVLSDPVDFVDPRGTDIWIEGASEGEPPLHRSISVGNYDEGYLSWTFGLEDNWEAFIPMPWRYGHVYKDVLGGGKVIKLIKTTPEEDRRAWRILESLEGERERYGLAYGNCRQFSEQMFDYFKELFDK